MQAKLAVVLTASALILGARPLVAGGPPDLDAESARAAKLAHSWKQQGVRALPSLVRALCGDDPLKAGVARDQIMALGPVAAARLVDSADGGCEEAATTLGELACGYEVDARGRVRVLAPLEKKLVDEQASVRKKALTLLAVVVAGADAGQPCSHANDIILRESELLVEALNDKDRAVQEASLAVLSHANSAASLPAFRGTLDALADDHRLGVVGIAPFATLDAEGAVPTLQRLLKSGSPEERAAVIAALPRLETHAGRLLPAVVAALQNQPCVGSDPLRALFAAAPWVGPTFVEQIKGLIQRVLAHPLACKSEGYLLLKRAPGVAKLTATFEDDIRRVLRANDLPPLLRYVAGRALEEAHELNRDDAAVMKALVARGCGAAEPAQLGASGAHDCPL